MRFVLATANPHKAREIVSVLAFAGVEIEIEPRPEWVPPVVEDGETLEDNARRKAIAICEATGTPALADDTGLEVDALNGEPGIHSARFAGPAATYTDNVIQLLSQLDGIPPRERRARFATVAIARWPDGREVAAMGTMEGAIAEAPRGEGGFGYDPVFVPDGSGGRTFAELSAAEKDACSHRGQAFRTLAEGLRLTSRAGHLEPGTRRKE